MKKIDLLFFVCFMLCITLPLVFIDRRSSVSEKEKRTLAVFPNFIEEDGRIQTENIKRFPQIFDGYLNDRFGFRNSIVGLANIMNTKTKPVNGNVVIGNHGWLFYSKPSDGNNIADFFKVNLFSDDEIKLFIKTIAKTREWCNANGIQFLFLIAPNKHAVYPEYYPFERPEGITRTEQVIAALPENLKDIVLYPFDAIMQNKTDEIPLYFETDTHWNMAGAYRAFTVLSNRIEQLFPKTHFPKIDFITDIQYDSSGDIVPMSGFTGYGKRTIPDMRPADGWKMYYQYEKYEGNNGRDGIITKNNDPSLPKVIIFRDSFFIALEPFTSTLFSSAEYNWRWFTETEKKYILEHRPDIIIWEIVERYMAGIIPRN